MSPYQQDHERLAWLLFVAEQDLQEGRTERAGTLLAEGHEIHRRHHAAADRLMIDRLEKLQQRQIHMRQSQTQELVLRHYPGDEHGQHLRGALQGYGMHISIHLEKSDNYDHTVRLLIGHDDESADNPQIEVEGVQSHTFNDSFTLLP